MKHKIVAIAFIAMIILIGCKKSSPKLYYYEAFEIGQEYPSSGLPSDSMAFIDSTEINYGAFQGDTIVQGPDSRFNLSGSYYKKRYQNFEVYRYTR
ncbi:MAG: hypothetical protein JSS76_19610 [Bacteroidetes bacterium]|nr:hypothetical protein [Bacteroidota bacterium]